MRRSGLVVPRRRSAAVLGSCVLLIAVSLTPRRGQGTGAEEEVYRTPAQALVDIVDAPQERWVSVDPGRHWLVLSDPETWPPIAELAKRELRLGGLRIDPQSRGSSRAQLFSGLRLLRLSDGRERPLAGMPSPLRAGNLRWSPDGAHLAFTQSWPDRNELWVVEAATATARRLALPPLSLVAKAAPVWLADSQSLVCAIVPASEGPEPAARQVPAGPVIQETAGRPAAARTYQDLLQNAYDAALFEHYLTAQLARVDLAGMVTALGPPRQLWRFDPSPDGSYVLVESLHRPFSYLVPAERFPRRVEILDRTGELLREIADLPLEEQVPITFDSVAPGPRSFGWRADASAALTWVEAQDGGNASRPAAVRDRIYSLEAPFSGLPEPLVSLGYRLSGISWGNDRLALISENWWKTRRTRTWLVAPRAGEAVAPRLLFDRSIEDRYGDPGEPVIRRDSRGRSVLALGHDGTTLYLAGEGASADGERPFLDALATSSGSKPSVRRLFRAEAAVYEYPLVLLDDQATTVLTRRETARDPTNFFVRDLAAGTLRQLTALPHPAPGLIGMHKELVHYRRKDGVGLSATLYLPAGYQRSSGRRLPLVIWAYPRSFKDAAAAAQVTTSANRFDQVNWASPLIWLLRGYAVLDDASMPIVGAGRAEPNDTFVEQLVLDAEAAVDEMVRRGVAERGRIAIGGHSYGAFMAANLLVHSRLFAAGIALSGAYNRTLTPFGFQAEERTLWQAPQAYLAMSPLLHADEIGAPILLVHGQADNNSGTDPLQSERFYAALKGLGATARLVLLPFESHGYRARESILHLLWEEDRWLERYVKQAPAQASSPTSAPAVSTSEASPPR
ncbi:MAG TPA: alpha/beta fold hydrolase [Thermoanaerobaculia bacterium]|nr:alpha/beta fold hydrolase [Thermoanaerobaculia bacterium]